MRACVCVGRGVCAGEMGWGEIQKKTSASQKPGA